MSAVLSIRIPRRLKEEMDKLRDVINWSEEIRKFIEERINMYKRQRVLSEVDEILNQLPSTPRGLATKLIREDRDSH